MSRLPKVIIGTVTTSEGTKIESHMIVCQSILVRFRHGSTFVSLMGDDCEHCFVYDMVFSDS